MIPLYAIPGEPAQAPLGMPMCQNRMAVPTWSYAMEVEKPCRLIEIGSYSGGLAIALGLHMYRLGGRLISYDRNAQMAELMPLASALRVEFQVGDVWEREGEIAHLITEPGKVFVLCDGGDKPRELLTFGKYLKPGDVIAAHDYDCFEDADQSTAPPPLERPWPWCETKKHDGELAAKAHGLVPFMQEHFDYAGWLAYRKA